MEKKSEKWKVKSSKYLMQKPWCTLREDHVVLNNGAEIPNYYVLEYPNWVNIIAITKEKEYLLVKQYRHGLQQIDYELPAGVCDETDSSPLATAKRELLEETGYGNGTWRELTVVSANPGTHTNLCYCFIATGVEKIGAQQLDTAEELELVKLNLKTLKEILLSDQIKQSMHAAPLWKYIAVNNLL